MRLFQSQLFYDENRSPPPPPHFSVERESTRMMPVYLSRYRDGRHRLPTPERVAVMELSSSFERRRLGKHQQILCDISQRCREQEVSDLSSHLSAKVNLRKYDRQDREVSFYTAFMGNKNKIHNNFGENIDTPCTQVDLVAITSGKPNMEKSYKHFPIRKIMKHNTKFDFIKPTKTAYPKVTYHLPKQTQERIPLKSRLLERQPINGLIQLNQHHTRRIELAPLITPSIHVPSGEHPNTERMLDRMDTCFSTKCLTLGPRQKTNMSQVARGVVGTNGPTKSKPTDFSRELSQLHLQHLDCGHSPPPNSEQEIDGALTV